MKVDLVVPQKTKDKIKVDGNSLLTQFKTLPLDEAVAFFETLTKKEQDHITATLLCYLYRNK